ncbi:hypothetical protein ACQY0O_001943 [Thecaphora frezii]
MSISKLKAQRRGPSAAAGGESVFIDPTDDATFRSLRRLLSAPASSTQHLSLLSANTLFGSITYYLSNLQIDHVADFAGVVAASGCLWTPPPPAREPPADPRSKAQRKPKVAWTTESQVSATQKKSDTGTSTSNNDVGINGDQLQGPDASPSAPSSQQPVTDAPQNLSAFLISRSTSIVQAVAAAWDRRVALQIEVNDGSTGWSTRRALQLWIESIVAGMSAVEATGQPESFKASRGLPVPRLAVLTGLLQGLYALREQRRGRRAMSPLDEIAALRANPKLGLRAGPYLSAVEDEWIVTFAEILEALGGPSSVDAAAAADASSSSSGTVEANDWEKEFRKRTAQLGSSAQITALASQSARLQAIHEVRDVPLFLAAQLASLIPDAKLQALDTEQLAQITSEAILSLFEADGSAQSCFMSSLAQDSYLSEEGGQVHLKADSATVRRVQSMAQTTLFASLGPLSKLLSRALAREATAKDPDSLARLLLDGPEGRDEAQLRCSEPLLRRMDRLAKELEIQWLSSPLAGMPESGIAEASRPYTAQLWTMFKTLLFSYTMAFDSLLDAVLDMCPSPTVTYPPAARDGSSSGEGDPGASGRRWPPALTSNLPPAYIRTVQSILETFSHLYWITSTFGPQGFDVYRKVFYSALDVLGRDGEGSVTLLERIQPVVSASQQTEGNAARRSPSTYFFDVAEQLLVVVPDEVIEQLLLPACRPYLEDTRFKETFESAHSVALAVYTHRKRCMFALAPFYSDLLLRSFPDRLDATQLEYAVTTVVTALAERSDSLCWWVVERVAQEVEEERKRQCGKASEQTIAVAEAKAVDPATEPTRDEVLNSSSSSDSASTPPRASDNDGAETHRTGSEAQEHPQPYPRLVTLELVLIACVPCVNLVLLRSLLAKVESVILQHQRRQHQQGGGYKQVVCEKTFEALQALNAATREEGVRWWLDNKARFEA